LVNLHQRNVVTVKKKNVKFHMVSSSFNLIERFFTKLFYYFESDVLWYSRILWSR